MHFQAIVAVRFCPVLFAVATLDEEAPGHQQPAAAVRLESETPTASPIRLPYNMVFAIATMDSVVIYETQVGCRCPLASFCGAARVKTLVVEGRHHLQDKICC